MLYHIQLPDGLYVAGFSLAHQIVQAGPLAHAKAFFTRSRAEAWGNKYANAGYALTTFTVVSSVDAAAVSA